MLGKCFFQKQTPRRMPIGTPTQRLEHVGHAAGGCRPRTSPAMSPAVAASKCIWVEHWLWCGIRRAGFRQVVALWPLIWQLAAPEMQ